MTASVRPEDLQVPKELSRRKVRKQLLFLAGVVLVIVAIVTLLPGLEGLRTRLSHANAAWLVLGVGLKVLSGLGYVAIFRMVFCRRMSWRVSYQIGMSEMGANALLPTGGAGGLALGAWALKRGGMPTAEIARRTAAFFMLTSVANVLGVVLIGVGLAARVLPGETNLALTLLPAAIAAAAIVSSLLAGRSSAGLHRRLDRNEASESSRRSRLLLKTLVAVADGVKEAVALLREGNAWLIGGILAYLIFDVMILWATFRAFGAAPPLAILGMAYLIGELGGLIPVPGGIGGVDAGLVGTFVLYNVPITAAVSAVIAYRAIALWVPAVLGSAAFVSLRRTLRRESAEISVCAPQTEMEVIGLGRVVIRPSPSAPQKHQPHFVALHKPNSAAAMPGTLGRQLRDRDPHVESLALPAHCRSVSSTGMSLRSSGPRRSESVESYLRQTRVGAALALLALAAAIASEQFAEHLWVRHPLLAGLASSAIVVMLSVAVVNEALEIRGRRRWRVLAQYVMLELVRDARMVWTAVVELAGLMPADANPPAAIDAAALVVRDTPRLTKAVHGLVADADRRRVLRDNVARLVVHNDEVLGRWASVMLSTSAYAEVVDCHVELAGSLAWLGSLLDQSEPSDGDQLRRHRARSNPAVQITGDMDDDRLAQRLVAITQLAEQLDRGTLDLAVKIVSVAWWEARLGTTAHVGDETQQMDELRR